MDAVVESLRAADTSFPVENVELQRAAASSPSDRVESDVVRPGASAEITFRFPVDESFSFDGATLYSGSRRQIDAGVVAELASSRPGPTTGRLEMGHSHGDDDPVVQLVRAEWASRRGEQSIGHLAALADDMASRYPDEPLLHWWASALLGERCAIALDLDGASTAAEVLDAVPGSALGPVPLLWVRGRLRRLAAHGRLLATPPDVTAYQKLQSAALADFVRCDLPTEVAFTRALGASMQALWLWEDQPENLAVVCDARRVLGETDSYALPLVDMLAVVLSLSAADSTATEQASTWLERTAPLAHGFRPHADAVLTIGRLAQGTADSDAAAAVAKAIEAVQSADPLAAHIMARFASAAVADAGDTAEARRLGAATLDIHIPHAVDNLDREVLATRLDLLAGRQVSTHELTALLDDITARGHPERAAGHARRLERDLTRIGASSGAAVLRTWTPSAPSPAPVTVRVLTPDVRVEVDGVAVSLRPQPARLLLAMIVAHPRALHAEEAAEHIWPDLPWSVARQRLNVVAHRLRQALGDHQTTMARRGGVFVLETDGWDVDLFHLRNAISATPEHSPRLPELLQTLTGNLAHAQFPYDERLIDERHHLAASVENLLANPEWSERLTADAPTIRRTLGITS